MPDDATLEAVKALLDGHRARLNTIFEQVGQLTERVATLERIGVLERERRGER